MINVLFRSLVKSVNLSSSFFGDYICHQKTSYILCSLPLGGRNLGSLKNKIPTIKKTSFTFWRLRTKLVQLECYKETLKKKAMICSSSKGEHVQSGMTPETPNTPAPFLQTQSSFPQCSWGFGWWFPRLFCSPVLCFCSEWILPSSETSTLIQSNLLSPAWFWVSFMFG